VLAIFVVWYIGVVTFWSRANPNAPPALRIAAYVLLLLFGDVYLFYVMARFAFFGITRRPDPGYKALHLPTPYFDNRKVRSASAGGRV